MIQLMRVAVAFDHRGVALREAIIEALVGHEVTDLGTHSADVRVDYPDKAQQIGDEIAGGRAERGVLVCGSGVGAAVAACKLAGIRAAICHDLYSAHQVQLAVGVGGQQTADLFAGHVSAPRAGAGPGPLAIAPWPAPGAT